MPKKEWTDEEIQQEIRDAVAIVQEDRERADYTRLHERFGQSKEPTDPNAPKPPPAKDPQDKPKPTGRRSIWWGEIEDDA